MKRALVIVLVACSAPPKPAPAPAHEPPKRDLAVAEPAPRQPAPPEAPSDPNAWIIDANRPRVPIVTRRVNQAPVELDVAERDLWSPCVRDFVQAQPPPTRRVLTAAFARYPASCNAEKRIVIDAPREYRDRFVVFRGPLAAMTFDLVTCGTSTSGPVAIVHDGKRWTGIATSSQVGPCTITSVPDMPSLRRVLREVVDAKDVTVQDVVVTDDMKRDLRLVLDALDALSAR